MLDKYLALIARCIDEPKAYLWRSSWLSPGSNDRLYEIVAEIERNRGLLATRLRNIPERHRSLQAIFTQTWRALTEQEREVFRRLAVFRGGFLQPYLQQAAGR